MVGEPFVLAPGETAALDEGGLRVTFARVTGDNRCPKEVRCIVAGAATVVVRAETPGAAGELTFEVAPGGSAEAEFEGYELSVLEVAPAARYGRSIDPEEYRVTLSVAKS